MKKILIIIILLLLLGGGYYLYKNHNTMKLIDFKEEDIKYVIVSPLTQENKLKVYSNKDMINQIYNLFKDKKTNVKDNGLNPESPEELYMVTFMKNDNKQVSISVYKKEYKYYFEMPNNGIYDCEESDFIFIKSLAR